MSNMIQKATAEVKASEGRSMQQYIKSMEGEIAKALPSVITPERFTRMVLSALSVNPQLGHCTPKSFLAGMMSAAQLGLEPNTPLGQAYLIPYKNKGVLEAQFQIGYKGLIDLAYRSGEVEVVQAHIVYEKDTFELEYGLNPKLTHIPCTSGDRGNPVRVYAIFKTKSGGYGFEAMSMDDVKAHAKKYSQAYSSGYSPWTKNFEEMAKKTVLKKVLKYAPLKSDFVREIAQDGAIKTEISEDMYSVPAVEIDLSDVEVQDVEFTEGTPNE